MKLALEKCIFFYFFEFVFDIGNFFILNTLYKKTVSLILIGRWVMYFNKMTSDSAHYSTSYPMFINTLNMNESYNRDSNSNRIQFIANIEEAMIILPTVFKNLAKKNEFITLIGSPKRFDKQWFKTHHLPLAHFLQINTAKPSIQSMRLVLQALSYGKTSAVVTWLSDTSTEQIRQLEQAAEFGDSIVYILPLTELIH